MTVATTTAYKLFSGIVAGTPLTFDVPIGDASEIVVLYGADKVATLTDDYTVSTNPSDPADNEITPTASLVTKAGTGGYVCVLRQKPVTQAATVSSLPRLREGALETALDKLTMLVQQTLFYAQRALRFPLSDPASSIDSLPAASARKGKVLIFNASTGKPEVSSVDYADLVNFSMPEDAEDKYLMGGPDGTIVAVAGVADAPVSGAMAPVVVAASLALARAAMSVPSIAESEADATSKADAAEAAAVATAAADATSKANAAEADATAAAAAYTDAEVAAALYTPPAWIESFTASLTEIRNAAAIDGSNPIRAEGTLAVPATTGIAVVSGDKIEVEIDVSVQQNQKPMYAAIFRVGTTECVKVWALPNPYAIPVIAYPFFGRFVDDPVLAVGAGTYQYELYIGFITTDFDNNAFLNSKATTTAAAQFGTAMKSGIRVRKTK